MAVHTFCPNNPNIISNLRVKGPSKSLVYFCKQQHCLKGLVTHRGWFNRCIQLAIHITDFHQLLLYPFHIHHCFVDALICCLKDLMCLNSWIEELIDVHSIHVLKKASFLQIIQS
ncbi:hypothetical protein PAXRUDRAFT_798050, partial [Paxillus rubicundulus Ve08.2h10]